MSVDHPLWVEHQRKRWMRPDADRWLNPTYEPKAQPTPEPAPTADVLAAVEEARREHLRLESMLIDLQIDLFRRHLARKYSPDQPRDDRGRWTDGGGEGMTDISAARRTRVAQNDSETSLNKHIKSNHVGKTDEQLKDRIRREQVRGWFASAGRDRNGSFESEESARDLIGRTLDNNHETVSSVARGDSARALVTSDFDHDTGREAYVEPPDREIRVRKTRSVGVVIAHDPRSSLGYRIVTAYPRNYNPRIGR